MLLKGNINKANYYYQLAAKVYPVNAKTNYYISQNYLNLFNQTGNRAYLKEALQEAKKAVELSPIKGEYQNHLGQLYWKLANYQKAEKHLQLGIEYGSYLIERYLDLGYFYYKRNRLDSASATLETGLQLKESALIAANKSYKRGRKKRGYRKFD